MNPHEEWFLKAERDLLSAKRLFEVGLYDTAIFHTQQCAEKILKAYLTFKKQPIQKTHDIVLLRNLCNEFDTPFQSILSAVVFLNSKDTQFRYPSDEMEPTHEEIVQAIKFAEQIVSFVKPLIEKN